MILLNIQYCHGYLLLIIKNSLNSKKYIETYKKIWAVMVPKIEWDTSYRNIHQITRSNYLISIILGHIIHLQLLYLIIWFVFVHFPLVHILYRVVNLIAQIEYFGVILVHGQTQPILRLTLDSWFLKYTHYRKCFWI